MCNLQIVEKDEIHSVKLALEDLISHLQSYKNYRRALHTAAPPCVPYLGNIYIIIYIIVIMVFVSANITFLLMICDRYLPY